jgi:hypothetical protein
MYNGKEEGLNGVTEVAVGKEKPQSGTEDLLQAMRKYSNGSLQVVNPIFSLDAVVILKMSCVERMVKS